MKSTHTIVIGIFTALSLGVTASAQAQTAGASPGMMGQMMQGHNMGGGPHGGMGAGRQGHQGPAQQGAGGPHQHGATGAGSMSGGCPVMSVMSQHEAPPTTQK